MVRRTGGMDARAKWEKPDPKKDLPSPLEQFGHWAKRRLGINVAIWQRTVNTILLLSILYMLMNPTAQTVIAPSTDLDPSGRTIAWALTEQWLKDEPLGANARIISWNGSKTIRLKNGSDGVKATANTLIVDSDLGWWKVTATVRDTDGQLAGWPAVERIGIPDTVSPNGGDDWTGMLGSLQPSQALTTLTGQWATALMGDDSAALTVLMTDPDPNASYRSLGLGHVENTSIEKAAYLDAGRVDRNNATSDRALIRVTITLKGRGEQAVQTQFTYDLLTSNPDGTPRILAWGAPGAGPDLKDYMNRLPANAIASDTTGTDDDTAADGTSKDGSR
ncbi:hypothetical protein [Bifidobacterium sp. SO1]|uniref:hypothetical protein n=1 Tax=Bifidobacterium sp. SO1 TaxID=2809029 RepID=UPI001BDC62D1|nr:hypothetical protein [Bifidobacterium sp. SO1]MBT1161770.1 hypothetical protein [Bifidobacterium sp. SO1]